jgi:exosortase E/protease (VPEID-CTERM system)
MATAIILSSGNSAVIGALRAIVEDTTLSLALVFYGLIGPAEPVLSLSDGTPLLAAPGFAILIGAPCAGYQGMLASATLMAGLIVLEWPTLRHGRAVILGIATIVGVFVFNALRIALLFHIGVSYSPEMAVDGFHSYFGTLSLLLLVGAAMLAMQHHSFRQVGAVTTTEAVPSSANAQPHWEAEAGILILPLAICLGIGMVLGLFTAGFNWTFPLLAVTGLVLMALWRVHIGREFSGGISWAGFAMGVAVYLLWLAIVPANPEADAAFAIELHSVPLSLIICWIIFRLIGFSIVVPVLEELAFRGGLHRLICGKLSSMTDERAAALIAFLLSSLAFGYMHADFFAGTMAGAGFGLLVLRSGRVGDAIVAHAVTNFMLAITAMMTGH